MNTQHEFAGYRRVPEAYSGDYKQPMTVGQLRELLSQFPDEAEVQCTCEAGCCTTGVYGFNRYGMESVTVDGQRLTLTLEGY